MMTTKGKIYFLILFLILSGCDEHHHSVLPREEKEIKTSTAVVRREKAPEPKKTGKKTAIPGHKNTAVKSGKKKKAEISTVVTFIELGSLGCVPCKMMQPVMKEVEEEYKGSVKVVFYDVWKTEGRPYAEKYGIRVIPTQVFLDRDGREYFRHEGFFPKDEIVKVLKKGGAE